MPRRSHAHVNSVCSSQLHRSTTPRPLPSHREAVVRGRLHLTSPALSPSTTGHLLTTVGANLKSAKSPVRRGAWWDLGQSAPSSQSHCRPGRTWARARPRIDRCESAVAGALIQTFRFPPHPSPSLPHHITRPSTTFAAAIVCVPAWSNTSSTFALDGITVLRCPLLKPHHPLGGHPSSQELTTLACLRRSDSTVLKRSSSFPIHRGGSVAP